jgi:hyperosmotically inducible periplasmic protein
MKTKVVNSIAALALGAVLALAPAVASAATTSDGAIQSDVTRQLQKSSDFKNVQSSVNDGVVTLTGSVETYKQKLDAEKKARKADHVAGVRDEIAVTSTVADSELREKIAKKLAYDRMGYWNVFNVLTADVNHGVVTLGGDVRTSADRESALDAVKNVKGVKDVVSNIKVANASGFDDDLRLRLARAIYRDPVLSRYALDPQAPIRIVVDNGHVGLYGVVDNKMDKQVAGMRANQVFGAFDVQNHLIARSEVSR